MSFTLKQVLHALRLPGRPLVPEFSIPHRPISDATHKLPLSPLIPIGFGPSRIIRVEKLATEPWAAVQRMTAALQHRRVDPKLYAQLDASLSRFAELMGKGIEVNTVARCRDAQRSAIDAVNCIEAAAGSLHAGDHFVWPEHRLMAGRQSDNSIVLVEGGSGGGRKTFCMRPDTSICRQLRTPFSGAVLYAVMELKRQNASSHRNGLLRRVDNLNKETGCFVYRLDDRPDVYLQEAYNLITKIALSALVTETRFFFIFDSYTYFIGSTLPSRTVFGEYDVLLSPPLLAAPESKPFQQFPTVPGMSLPEALTAALLPHLTTEEQLVRFREEVDPLPVGDTAAPQPAMSPSKTGNGDTRAVSSEGMPAAVKADSARDVAADERPEVVVEGDMIIKAHSQLTGWPVTVDNVLDARLKAHSFSRDDAHVVNATPAAPCSHSAPDSASTSAFPTAPDSHAAPVSHAAPASPVSPPTDEPIGRESQVAENSTSAPSLGQPHDLERGRFRPILEIFAADYSRKETTIYKACGWPFREIVVIKEVGFEETNEISLLSGPLADAERETPSLLATYSTNEKWADMPMKLLVMEYGGETEDDFASMPLATRKRLFRHLVSVHQNYGLVHFDVWPRNAVWMPTREDPVGNPRWIDWEMGTDGHVCKGGECLELQHALELLGLEDIVEEVRAELAEEGLRF